MAWLKFFVQGCVMVGSTLEHLGAHGSTEHCVIDTMRENKYSSDSQSDSHSRFSKGSVDLLRYHK